MISIFHTCTSKVSVTEKGQKVSKVTMVIFVARDLIDRVITKIKIKIYIKALIFHVISSGHMNSTF
jgi:hypothetical protein